jgi:hypothetical protein
MWHNFIYAGTQRTPSIPHALTKLTNNQRHYVKIIHQILLKPGQKYGKYLHSFTYAASLNFMSA